MVYRISMQCDSYRREIVERTRHLKERSWHVSRLDLGKIYEISDEGTFCYLMKCIIHNSEFPDFLCEWKMIFIRKSKVKPRSANDVSSHYACRFYRSRGKSGERWSATVQSTHLKTR